MPTEKRLLGVDGVKQIAAEVYGIIAAHNTGENSHDNLKTRISDLENSIDSFATEDYVDNAVDEIDVLTEAEISEICGSTVGNLTLVDQDAVAEQVVDTLMDEIDFLTKEEISEICGSTVGDLTVVDQDAIAEQVVDTLMEELPTNQVLVDNVAEKVPIVKVAEQPTFVDSVDEMTDTSKVYVLSSTGMIWAYGKVGKQPAFTDLTKQDGWTWAENSRTNSSGTFTADTGTYASDYIPCKLGDIVRVCALDLRTSLSNAMSVQFFNNSKTFLFTGGSVNLKPAGIITVDGELITIQGGKTSDDGSTVIDNANIAYMRICGIPFDGYTIDDVIITVNEEIVYTETDGSTTITYPNQFVPDAAELNKRYSGSSQSTTTKTGYFVTDYIAVPDFASVTPYNARLNWEVPSSTATDVKIAYFDASKTHLGLVYIADANNSATANGKTTIDLRAITGSNAPTDVSAVAYVRIQLAVNSSMASLTAADIENLTITFDAVFETESTESVTTQTWSSTGIAYNQPADYEDRVISLEANVANNTGNITLLQERMNNLESGEVATVIPEWWEDEVADTIAKVKALQIGKNCVTFPFFSDNHQRNGYVGVLIKRVMDECHIPYCFYGGDSISSGIIIDEAEMIAQDKAFDTAMSYIPNGRFCRAVGNHDGYWYDGTNKFWYTREQVYELFLREESVAQNKHFGADGTYYYVDDIASKMRWIVLNFNGYDDAQLAWLDTALTFPESGWGVVFIAHAPITSHYLSYNAKDATVREKIKTYINGTSANKADVVGWFAGHIHRDRIFEGVAANPGYNGSTDPATDAANGAPIAETLPWKTVSIISDNVSIGYGGVKHAIDNSDQSHAIDFVTINKSTRTVNLTRLGFGDDRSFTY